MAEGTGTFLRQPRTIAILACLCIAAFTLRAQEQRPLPQQKQNQAGTTIRIDVGLVQTDVMVFDRKGNFVPDLKKDQFELRVDGRVQPIAFFEMVSAGSVYDREIWTRKEGGAAPGPAQLPEQTTTPGRTLLYFVDDWHLSADSVVRLRQALKNLIDTSAGPEDRIGIFAASGQLGSAQQLTGDKAALLAILNRLNFQSGGVEDLQYPPMTEAQASMILQGDEDALMYFVEAIVQKDPYMNTYSSGALERAKREIRRRAAFLAETSAGIGERSLSALSSMLHAAEALPGRKMVFLLSDGFVLQTQLSDVVSRLSRLTTAAARAGIMIYTLDARGLMVGLPDAKKKIAPDSKGLLAHSGVNEIYSSQDVLNVLAADTGGRFLKNTNALDTALITTLNEVSRYYVLAWSVDPEKLQPGKSSRIRATVKGRSDLRVRVRQGTLDLSQLVSKEKK